MDKLQNINSESIYLVEYDDAAFSYEDFSPKLLVQMTKVKSVGWVREQNEDFLDLGIEREIDETKIKYLKGILIPYKAIHKVTKLYEK